MEVFAARRPVFDSGKDVYGYELEFRSGFEPYYEALRTRRDAVDLMAFVSFAELTDGKKGFVNFSRDLLLAEFPILFARDSMVAGVPAPLGGDDEIVDRCRDLKNFGYELAIQGFSRDQLDSPLLDLADIVEVDFARTAVEGRAGICRELAGSGVRTLARQIRTSEDAEQALGWGYDYLEGDFFSKPVPHPGRGIPASKLIYLRLLREVSQTELDYDQIAALIGQDVSMTYRLLRFMNSAWFGLRCEVWSVKHALVLLGPEEVRRWAALLAVRNAAEDKPHELLLCSLTRAKLAEHLGTRAGMGQAAGELFLMGMFSLLDALTDIPLPQVLEELPLNENVKEALLGGDGQFGRIRDIVVHYEKGKWDAFSRAVAELKVPEQDVPEMFRKSLTWASQALRESA